MVLENKVLKNTLEWSYCIIVAVILALLIRYYFFAPTMVKQASMYPTLKEKERVLLNRLNRITRNEYKRGDIITFEAPNGKININSETAVYINEPEGIIQKLIHNVLELNKKSYIKRIIGVAGDKIQIINEKVYLNGEEIEEDYLNDGIVTKLSNYNNLTVPEGYVFVMGDNREVSTDSRAFGCIPIEKICGRVCFRYWPLSEFGKIKK